MAKDRFDIQEKEGVSFMTDALVIVDKETGEVPDIADIGNEPIITSL